MHSIPRSTERHPLSLMIKSRVQSRVVYVDLVDISEGGCKVRGSAGFTKIGDRILLKVGEVNAPLGKVAWVEGKYAGVSFEGTLHPGVLDHLRETRGGRLLSDPEDKNRKV
ncbi:MAG: PilZ domain-containing protein [Pseudomonadota bacterium]